MTRFPKAFTLDVKTAAPLGRREPARHISDVGPGTAAANGATARTLMRRLHKTMTSESLTRSLPTRTFGIGKPVLCNRGQAPSRREDCDARTDVAERFASFHDPEKGFVLGSSLS